MATLSPLLRLLLMDYDEFTDTWGGKLNTDVFEALEQAVVGYNNVAVLTGSEQQLTDDQMGFSLIRLTGTLDQDHTVLLAARNRVYKFENVTSGDFVLTVKAETGDATGVTLPPNATTTVRYDGTVLRQVFGFDLPVGTIMDWYGDPADVPYGWAVCDGTGGTPDLRDRVRIGASATYPLGDAGGSASANTDSQGAHTHSVSTDSAGSHNHGGATGSTVLTTAQMPAHEHKLFNDVVLNEGPTNQDHASYYDIRDGFSRYKIVSDDKNPTLYDSAPAGGNQGHTHVIGSSGTHSHTGTAASNGAHTHAVSTMQPHFAVHAIMRVGN